MSVLLPTTTHTGGRVILASTPPEDPAHDFIQFIEKAEKDKLLTKKTVYDNPLLTAGQIENIVSKFSGGVNNTQFRREYLCIEASSMVTVKKPDGTIVEMSIKDLKNELSEDI